MAERLCMYLHERALLNIADWKTHRWHWPEMALIRTLERVVKIGEGGGGWIKKSPARAACCESNAIDGEEAGNKMAMNAGDIHIVIDEVKE